MRKGCSGETKPLIFDTKKGSSRFPLAHGIASGPRAPQRTAGQPLTSGRVVYEQRVYRRVQ